MVQFSNMFNSSSGAAVTQRVDVMMDAGQQVGSSPKEQGITQALGIKTHAAGAGLSGLAVNSHATSQDVDTSVAAQKVGGVKADAGQQMQAAAGQIREAQNYVLNVAESQGMSPAMFMDRSGPSTMVELGSGISEAAVADAMYSDLRGRSSKDAQAELQVVISMAQANAGQSPVGYKEQSTGPAPVPPPPFDAIALFENDDGIERLMAMNPDDLLNEPEFKALAATLNMADKVEATLMQHNEFQERQPQAGMGLSS